MNLAGITIKFDYKLVCSQFITTYYVIVSKTIYIHYLKKNQLYNQNTYK